MKDGPSSAVSLLRQKRENQGDDRQIESGVHASLFTLAFYPFPIPRRLYVAFLLRSKQAMFCSPPSIRIFMRIN